MLSTILGPEVTELLRQDGSAVAVSVAADRKDYVLVYLSASWCPPCRLFTPQLASFYELFSEKHNFEVVFVSRDRDERSMQAYFYNPKYSRLAVRGGEGSHGDWLAVPYEHARTIGGRLMQEHRVPGIPTVLLFDLRSGELLTSNARALVFKNLETAAGFPWAGENGDNAQGFALCPSLLAVLMFALLLYMWL